MTATTAVRLVTAAAAVVLVGVIGITLRPATTPSGVGALVSAVPSSRPGASPSPSQMAITGPVDGPLVPLAAGRHHIDVPLYASFRTVVFDGTHPVPDSLAAVRVTFDLPAGWSGNGGAIARDAEAPAALGMSPWTVGDLYRTPCRPSPGKTEDPPHLRSVDGLTGAMITWWRGSDRSGPNDWPPQATGWVDGTLGGLAGRYLEVTSDRNIAGCDGGQNVLWEDQRGRQRVSTVPGERDRLWILDASRHVILSPEVIASGIYGSDPEMQVLPLVIDVTSQPGASPEDLAELQGIVESIEFEIVDQAVIPSEGGRLAFQRDGNIYLADLDGSDPIRITENAGRSSLSEGTSWAPNGRHLLYLEELPGGTQARISDASGRLVASFRNDPGFNGYPVWSPDSAHLQAWSRGFTRISIYGIDGALEASVPLPGGYARFQEDLGAWAPDGRSVVVWIARTTVSGGREAWQLPVDGSAPRRLAGGELIGRQGMSISPDGSRVAFAVAGQMMVAASDGSGLRAVAHRASRPWLDSPVWSPSGQLLAWLVPRNDRYDRYDLILVDAATGTSRSLVADDQLHDVGWPAISWSPSGDRILFPVRDELGLFSLWSVASDGVGDDGITIMVEGAYRGEWQPRPTR